MIVMGTLIDGRTLRYNEQRIVFYADKQAVSLEEVRAADAHASIRWSLLEQRDWMLRLDADDFAWAHGIMCDQGDTGDDLDVRIDEHVKRDNSYLHGRIIDQPQGQHITNSEDAGQTASAQQSNMQTPRQNRGKTEETTSTVSSPSQDDAKTSSSSTKVVQSSGQQQVNASTHHDNFIARTRLRIAALLKHGRAHQTSGGSISTSDVAKESMPAADMHKNVANAAYVPKDNSTSADATEPASDWDVDQKLEQPTRKASVNPDGTQTTTSYTVKHHRFGKAHKGRIPGIGRHRVRPDAVGSPNSANDPPLFT